MTGALINHLWQSTLFAAAAGLLAIAFRKNRAQVRYWLWFSASLKFLVPFSLLTRLGSQLEWAPATKEMVSPAVTITMAQIALPFAESAPPVPYVPDGLDWTPIAIFGVWICGFAGIALIRFRGWLRIRDAVRSSRRIDLPAAVEVRSSPGLLEPGVVGFLHPILLVPAGIAERLTPPQLEAVLAHELCHVRRRDNLFASIHMIVEAVFWFHPLAWWIGARLVEERERACDEEVLSLGSEPRVYAEGILNVCKLYVESPLACVSGVTGSNLKERVEAIMTNRVALRLNLVRKVALACAGMAALALPVVVGMMNAHPSRAQSKEDALTFEVASVKPANPDSRGMEAGFIPGGSFRAVNVTLKELVAIAYNITCASKNSCPERISGGPGWIDSARFVVVAKASQPAQASSLTQGGQLRQRLQALLADRFKLVVRRETKEMPVYHLVVARNGPKFKEYVGDAPGGVRGRGNGQIIGESASLYGLVGNLTGIVGRPVVDRTGLTGRYDFKLEWVPEVGGGGEKAQGASVSDLSGPSIFAALQEQLGLKLEPHKGPVEMIVIEGAEKPSEN